MQAVMLMLTSQLWSLEKEEAEFAFLGENKNNCRKKNQKMTEEANFADQIENDKNKTNVRCQFCNSLMIKAQEAKYCEQKIDVPLMTQKQQSKSEDLSTEELKHFWLIEDMMMFENIGFSHTVNGLKFLVCADCERGPVGYHELSTKRCYVALKRVVHIDV